MTRPSFQPIGHLKTCFTEKFGTPRQSGLIPAATGILKLEANADYALALQQLETFSHIWLLFLFDRHEGQEWRPLIEPPRVGAPRKVGVFASRSPHRPNPIGLSAVKLDRIDFGAPGGVEIHVSGVDILDGTPVLDIKPYLPYADIVADASEGWTGGGLDKFAVTFSPESLATLELAPYAQRQRELIEQMLSWDPRPTSQRKAMPLKDPANEGRIFRFRVAGYDVEWQILGGAVRVLALHRLG